MARLVRRKIQVGSPRYAGTARDDLTLLLATTALTLLLSLGSASAQTTWIAGDGNWNTAANWSPAVVPNGGTDVVIDRPGSIVVTHSNGAHTVGRLTSEENLVLSGGGLAIDGVSTLAGKFTLSGGALIGAGDLSIGGATLIQGGASLPTLGGSGRLITNDMLTFGGALRLQDQRILDIRAGAIWTGGELGMLDSAGIVNAAGSTFTDSGRGSLTGSGPARFENAGVYRKQDGATTTIFVPFVNQATGTIELVNSDLDLAGDGSSISGKLRIGAGRTLTFSGTNNTMRGIDGLNAEGRIVVGPDVSLAFKGLNQFDGTLAVIRGGRVLVETGLVLGSLDLRGPISGFGRGVFELRSANLDVLKDYANDRFGTGNGFNARANVIGAGVINGVGAEQAIVTGGVASTAPVVDLDFGLLRGGTSKTLTYRIANTGSGADIRGAVQTVFEGGGVSDARLSGAGVSARNFGPIAAGASTGELAVTIAAGGGALSGQSVRVVNNFANVAEQVITFSGGESTQLALGNAVAVPTGGSLVDLGKFRVGVTAPSRSFDVTNTTTGIGAERLGIGSVTTSANFVASGVSSALIAPGAAQAAAFTLGVGGGAAGVNTGFASIQYVSNGQLLDPTFTSVASNVQDIAVKATGYALANPNALPPTLSFGTVVKGSAQSRFLTISNDLRSGVPAGFQEGLDATFGSVTGGDAARFSVGGALSNLAAGGVNSAALSVKLNTSAIGSFSASVPVLFKSNGAGTSGFGLLDLPTQTLGLSAGVIEATVVNPAAAGILNVEPVSVAARRVGDAAAFAMLEIRNTAEPIAETLSASFGGATGSVVTSGTTISGLGAQTTDAITMRVGIDTATAGLRSGTATVDFKGDISTTLASQSVEVIGKVYQRAEADSLAPARLDFGVVRSGDAAPTRSLAIGNAAPVAGLNDVLLASASVATRAFAVAVDPSLERPGLRAGETLADGFTASMSTRGFGLRSATATIAFESGNPDMAPEEIGTRSVELVGQVNEVAVARFDKVAGDGAFNRFKSGALQVDFGTIEFGQTVEIELSLANAIEFGDSLAGRFDLSTLGAAITATGFDPVLIAAGASEDGLILDFAAFSLGSYAGFLTFDWASVYPGLVDLAGSAIRIDVVANVVRTGPPSDVPEPATIALLVVAGGWLLARRRPGARPH